LRLSIQKQVARDQYEETWALLERDVRAGTGGFYGEQGESWAFYGTGYLLVWVLLP
jgi:hypothetical protein